MIARAALCGAVVLLVLGSHRVDSASPHDDQSRAASSDTALGDGIVAYTRSTDGGYESWISAANLAGNARRALTPRIRGGKRQDHSPAWSPAGDQVAFIRLITVGPMAGRSSLHVVDRSGSNERLVKRLGKVELETSPTWSPDGTQIAFGGGPLWVLNADGSDGRRLVSDSTCSPEWSPDGLALVYLVDDSCGGRGGNAAAPGYRRIYRINADGSQRKLLAQGSFGDAAWSPDGTKFAYTANCSVQHDVDWSCSAHVMDANGTHKTRIVKETHSCGCVSWVGVEPTVLWNRGGLYATDPVTGRTHTVLADDLSIPPIGQSTDGSTIAVSSWDLTKIVVVTATGRRVGRTNVPHGWTLNEARAFLG